MPDEGARRESGGHGTTVLFSGGRAALAHRRVSRVSGSAMVNCAG